MKIASSLILSAPLMLGSTTPLMAQDGAPPQGTPAPPVEIAPEAAPVRSVRPQKPKQICNQILAEKGWAAGYDSAKKQFIVVGEAPIAVQPGEDGWPLARAQAYSEAMLAAKRQLSQFISAEVKRRIGVDKQKPENRKVFDETRKRMNQLKQQGTKPEDMSMLDKVSYVAHQEMNKFIDSRDYKPEGDAPLPRGYQDEAIDTAINDKDDDGKVVLKKEWQDRIDVVSAAETAGLATYQVIESANHIGVICLYNEKATHALAAAMLGKGSVDKKAPKDPLNQYLQRLDSDGTLMYTQGVRLRTDQNGDLCLLAFGHSGAEYDDPDFVSIAADEAMTIAMGELRSFAGEFVDSATAVDRASTTEKLAGEAKKLKTRYSNRSSYNGSIKAVSQSLRMPGMVEIYSSEYIHPDQEANDDTRPTVVSVVVWNLSAAQAAAELGAKMASLGGSRGGVGVQAPKPTAEAGSGAQPRKRVPAGNGRGAGGDDDDFGGGR